MLILQLNVVVAQFENFFGNMFGGHQQQQQQQQQHQQQRNGASQFSAYLDSGKCIFIQDVRYTHNLCLAVIVSCSQYLCPMTLDCVDSPSECPCPNAEDIKCLIPDMDGDVDDATVVCVRGQQECAEVERLMKRFSDGKRK